MTADVDLLPLHLIEAFSQALKGGRGELDAWLEVNNEADVRLHVEGYARAVAEHNIKARDAEIEALRAEVERLQRQLRQTHKDYGCELRDPNGTIWEYAAAQKARAERLAEALRWYANPEVYKPHPHGPAFDDRDLSFKARAALRDHDKEMKDE